MAFQYIELANEIENKILNGDFLAGDKLPSLRKMHQSSSNSISTIHQAYLELEKRGMVEAKEKSGFIVRPTLHERVQIPEILHPRKSPKKLNVCTLAKSINDRRGDPNLVSLGEAKPSNEILPLKQFSRIFKSLSHEDMDQVFGYDHILGSLDLRRQIAKRTLNYSQRVSSDEIVITNGAMDAIGICLRAVAKPGDIIAVESPTYYGVLQLIEQNNMFALELPTDINEGIDLNHLEDLLKSQKIKACFLNPSFQNPLGFVMPTENRKQLVELTNRKNIPIIEDDIFGELHFDNRRPPTLKSFDKKGLVLYCSSFSKTLAPGLRVGWTVPGRFLPEVRALKSNLTLSSTKLNQYIVVQFLKKDSYDRQLRFIQNELKKQMCAMTHAVIQYFPKDTKISSPGGGLNLWVQLNDSIDVVELHKEALHDNILVMPGILCSGSNKYRNCIRMGCGNPLDKATERALKIVGELVYDMIV